LSYIGKKCRRKPPLSKKQSEHIHFKKQLRERYGIRGVGRREIEELIEKAQRADLEVRQSNRVTVKRIIVRGHSMFVVYDSVHHSLVTALPSFVTSPEQVNEYVARR